MNKFLAPLTLATVLSLTACASAPERPAVRTVSYERLLFENRTNFERLTLGLTRSQVVEIMGSSEVRSKRAVISNPYQTRSMNIGNHEYEVLYYLVERHKKWIGIDTNQAAPVILRDGKVVGLGRGDLDRAIDGAFE